MTPPAEVTKAIEEIARAFPEANVTTTAGHDGSAWVVVDPVDLGSRWAPTETWIGFRIAESYPYADVYPHYIDGDLRLGGGDALPVGLARGQVTPVGGQGCIQVSRRSNRLNPATDSALSKLIKVVHWLREL